MSLASLIGRQLDVCSEKIAPQWGDLRGSRILITGGSGFFGLWILSAINQLNEKQREGIEAIVVTRNPELLLVKLPFLRHQNKIKLIEGDVRYLNQDIGHFDNLIHGAATSATETHSGVPSIKKFDLLVDGTRRIMDIANAAHCSRAIFLSSGIVYGQTSKNEPIGEETLHAPSVEKIETGLAHGKRAAEYIFIENCRQANIDGKVARCFSFVGAGLPHDIHYAIGNFAFSALRNEKIIIHSDGRAVRSYLDVRDFLVWLGLMLTRDTNHILYNIGSPISISIADLASLIRQSAKSHSQVIIRGDPLHAIGNEPRSFYVPDTARFITDYVPPKIIPLQSAISDYLEYLKHLI